MAIETQYKQLLIEIIHKHIPNCRIWLFGSRARKTHKEGADIDLAVDAGRALTLNEVSEVKEAIGESDIPLFVDLVDINNVSEDFLHNIKKEWVEWTR